MVDLFKDNVMETGLGNQVILLYGRAKVGKTTLAAEFPNPVFLATESGHGYLKKKVKICNCSNWSKFIDACKYLAKGEHDRKTVIIDTIDNLVDSCTEHICAEQGIGHPSELAMGKGWALVTSELRRTMTKLSLLPYTLVMVSHSVKETIETSTGRKYDRWSIAPSGKNKGIFLNMSDMILFIDFVKDGDSMKRIIRTKPCQSWEAGDRTGKLPAEMPLDYEELYNKLI